MFHYSYRTPHTVKKTFVVFVVAAMLFGSLPTTTFAEDTNATSTDSIAEEPTELTGDSSGDDSGESSAGENATSTTQDTGGEGSDTATSTEETSPEDETATSTATSSDEVNTDNDGSNGEGGLDSGDSATTTATSTDGTDGNTGSDGSDGTPADNEEVPESTGTTTSSDPDMESDPIPLLTEGLLGDDDSPEDEDITGGRREHSSITTGVAAAQGEVFTDANSTNVRSEYDPGTISDLDFYTFNATGSNEAVILNEVGAYSLTGENTATVSRGEGTITTGDAISAFNIANVINSTIVNSDGYIYLANQILEDNTPLNLQDFFFPSGDSILAEANNCSLLSCAAEDIEYNLSQTNHATITNDAYIEAITGDNVLSAASGDVITGNAYGAANVVNIVNTNVIDSNYRLLTFNAVGDLDGDLILPTEELFDAFFGMPNGMNQLEHSEEAHVHVENQNNVDSINNNLDTYAESGLNDVVAPDGDITTGKSEAESNILNKVNQNVFGGDLMYLWIRVHGYWSGDVVGLPDGLTWEWTPDGIIIYNENAEITPSEFLGYDIDSYTANFENQNDVTIDNNIYVDAITGRNEVNNGLHADVHTGDAFASANVMNIANTNVIGANWTMAVINILGDFDGNVTFSQTDLSLVGDLFGNNPLNPEDSVLFTYTIANSSDTVATDIVLTQALVNAHIPGGTGTLQSVSLGDLAPGESTTVDLTGVVNSDLSAGTNTVKAVAKVESAEGDTNASDNTLTLVRSAFVEGTSTSDDGTTTPPVVDDGDTNATTSTSTDPEVTQENNDDGNTGTQPVVTTSGGGGGGGNNGGSSTETKKVDRKQKDIDPDSAPLIFVEKTSSVDTDHIVAAGDSVDYTITVTNNGGTAYDTTVYDTLRNPIGSVLNEDSWDLGTILPGEEITLEYTTTYDFKTPSGIYTNTAHIEAYRSEDGKENGDDPLELDDAVHTVEIEGVPLAIGNVGVVAFYPGGNGGINALLTWETSKPATGQIFYSEESYASLYNPLLTTFGYQYVSFRFETPKTKHYMILRNLNPGTKYEYKIRSTRGTLLAVRGDFYFTVPYGVSGIALVLPDGRVAGLSTSAPTPTPVSTPVAPAPTAAPTPTPVVKTPVSTPESDPVPEPSTPEPQASGSTGSSGAIGGFVNKVFGFFR